eukprot:10076888-Alexandrium_andersonii.AAC.1
MPPAAPRASSWIPATLFRTPCSATRAMRPPMRASASGGSTSCCTLVLSMPSAAPRASSWTPAT